MYHIQRHCRCRPIDENVLHSAPAGRALLRLRWVCRKWKFQPTAPAVPIGGTVMRVAIKMLNSFPRAFISTPLSYSVSVFAAGLYTHRYPLPKLQKAHILHIHVIIYCLKCKDLFFLTKNVIKNPRTGYSTIRYRADSTMKLAVAGRIASQKPTPTRSFSAGSAGRARMLRGSSNHTACARPLSMFPETAEQDGKTVFRFTEAEK